MGHNSLRFVPSYPAQTMYAVSAPGETKIGRSNPATKPAGDGWTAIEGRQNPLNSRGIGFTLIPLFGLSLRTRKYEPAPSP